MIVECDRCYARYRYEESRFEGKPSKKLRCTKCLAIFEVFNTGAFEKQPPVVLAVSPDSTVVRRPSDRPKQETTRKSRLVPVERPEGVAVLKLPTDVKLSIAVIAGPDAGKIFTIEKPRVVIGRQGSDINLDDSEISRHHAAIEVAGEKVTVVDLGSTNGTFVEDEPVSEALLAHQAEFSIGGSTLMLIVTSTG